MRLVIWDAIVPIMTSLWWYAPSQWEATLDCNIVSHWLGTYTRWSLKTAGQGTTDPSTSTRSPGCIFGQDSFKVVLAIKDFYHIYVNQILNQDSTYPFAQRLRWSKTVSQALPQVDFGKVSFKIIYHLFWKILFSGWEPSAGLVQEASRSMYSK